MEEPIYFHNRNGKKLFGVVHVPEYSCEGRARTGVNLLNPGIKYRVAPHRLNLKIARRLCEEGFWVLRFDPEGIGDSEGELPIDQEMPEIWGSIQRGRFVSDVQDSNDFFIEKYEIDNLLVAGNCGGAITAILTGRFDNRIKGFALVDVPVLLMGSDYSFADKIVNNKEAIEFLFQAYLKRLFTISAWKRFFSGETDKKALWTVLGKKTMRPFIKAKNEGRNPDNNEKDNTKKLNIGFFEAFESIMAKKKKVIFISAGGDLGTESFNVYFKDRYLMQEVKYFNLVESYIVETANHIYTLIEWQDQLIDKIINWIKREAA